MNELVKSMMEKARQEVEGAWSETKLYTPIELPDAKRISAQATKPTQEAKGKTTGMLRLDPVGKSALVGKELLSHANRTTFTYLDSSEFAKKLVEFLDSQLAKVGYDRHTLSERYSNLFENKRKGAQAAFSDVLQKEADLLMSAASVARSRNVLWEEKSNSDKMTWIEQRSNSMEMKQRLREIKRQKSSVVVTVAEMEHEILMQAKEDKLDDAWMAGLLYLNIYENAILRYNAALASQEDEAQALSKVSTSNSALLLMGRSLQKLMLAMEKFHADVEAGVDSLILLKPHFRKKRFFFQPAPQQTADVFRTEDEVYAEAKLLVEGATEIVLENQEGVIRIKGTNMILDMNHENFIPPTIEEMLLKEVKVDIKNSGFAVLFGDFDILLGSTGNFMPLVTDTVEASIRPATGVDIKKFIDVPLSLMTHKLGEKDALFGMLGNKPACLFLSEHEGQTVTVKSVLSEEDGVCKVRVQLN